MYLFVYGSLKMTGSRSHVIQDYPGEIIDPFAYTYGTLYDYKGMFPALDNHKDDYRVYGELWHFPEDVSDILLNRLDQIEGHPQLFERIDKTVWFFDGDDSVTATVYVGAYPGLFEGKILEDGIWPT